MTAKKKVSVEILDQKFNITTDASPERVQQIADFVDERIKQVAVRSKNASPFNSAVLAALNIAEMYFDAVEREAELKTRVVQKSKKILGLLDQAGGGPNA